MPITKKLTKCTSNKELTETALLAVIQGCMNVCQAARTKRTDGYNVHTLLTDLCKAANEVARDPKLGHDYNLTILDQSTHDALAYSESKSRRVYYTTLGQIADACGCHLQTINYHKKLLQRERAKGNRARLTTIKGLDIWWTDYGLSNIKTARSSFAVV